MNRSDPEEKKTHLRRVWGSETGDLGVDPTPDSRGTESDTEVRRETERYGTQVIRSSAGEVPGSPSPPDWSSEPSLSGSRKG